MIAFLPRIHHKVISAIPKMPRWVKGLALAAAWIGLWGAGHLGEFAEHASIWYPPAALTFASLVVLGAKVVPYLVLASLGGTVWSISVYQIEASFPVLAAFGLVIAAAHIGCYALGAGLLRHYAAKHRQQLPKVIIAFLLAAFGSSAAATVAVVGVLKAFDMLGPEGPVLTALAFWTGDFVAVVVLGPLFGALLLRLARSSESWVEAQQFLRLERIQRGFGLKLGTMLLLVIAVMAVSAYFQSYETAFLVCFVLIPQLWLTFTEPPLATTVSLAITSFLIILLLALLDLGQFGFVYQLAIAIIATSAYFGLAIPLLEHDNRQLRQQLMFDPLTGAATRDYLRKKVEQLTGEAAESQQMSLAVIDLDHFKRINDSHGHSLGDQALVALVEALRLHLRGTDVLARYGGDEFIALLMDRDQGEASHMLQAAQDSIRAIRLPGGVELTASIGLATRRPGEDFSAWFARADHWLYEAKKAGRDRLYHSAS